MFHYTNYGMFGNGLPCDKNGFVPEPGDSPWDFDFDHGLERTHDENGNLTEYGEWFAYERFPDMIVEAQSAIQEANELLLDWQNNKIK